MQLNRIGNDCPRSRIKFIGSSIDVQVNSEIARAMFAIKQVKHILSCHILYILSNI